MQKKCYCTIVVGQLEGGMNEWVALEEMVQTSFDEEESRQNQG